MGVKKLNIAIVAYNYDLSRRALRKIAENDNSQITEASSTYIRMDDGTIYYMFSTFNHIRGRCIDQLIIVDDYRWMVYANQEELIRQIKYRMIYSCVPEEYQIIEYEW